MSSNNANTSVGNFFLPRRQLLRGCAVLTVVFASLYSSKKKNIPSFLIGNTKWKIHLLSFASFFGCTMWVTFVAGLVMFRNMPRHAFGRLQAKLFPRYFQFSIIMVGMCICLDLMTTKTNTLLKLSKPQQMNLYFIFLTLLVNLLIIEPKTTAIMFERHIVERRLGTGQEVGKLKPVDPKKALDPELVALSKRFGMMHGISSTLNLATVCLAAWHLCWLGSKLNFD